MEEILEGEKVTIRSWAVDVEVAALEQAKRTGRLSVLAGPIALMPDCHYGIGATVGSVIPTVNAILPAAVGVDIGCGMIAVETDLTAQDLPDTLNPLIPMFSRSVPSGVGKGHLSARPSAEDWYFYHKGPVLSDKLANTAITQLGSLGSGNHFLEVSLDERDIVWGVVHSGSRGVGNQLAHRHIKLARAQEQALEDPDLSYFLDGTPEFKAYVDEMLWCQDYALQNREIMMDAALRDVFGYVGKGQEVRRINCHHNFAARELHNGQEMWITRKGAIKADRGDLGVIPGSMGTRSYIVEGLGSSDSYNSSAHGAGRRMSRGQARRELTVESLNGMMKGKAWNSEKPELLLDEHPSSYKDIDVVMEAQKDLVRIVHTLHQVANYKGV